jgi:hypothetical protein
MGMIMLHLGAGIAQSVVSGLRAGKPTNRDTIAGWGMRFFFTPKRPDRLWRRHSFLFNDYPGILPGRKRQRRGNDHSHPYSAKVRNLLK